MEDLEENNQHAFPAEDDDSSSSLDGETLQHVAEEETDVMSDGNVSNNIEFAQAIGSFVSTPTKPTSKTMTENSASSNGVPRVPYQSNGQPVSHSEEEYHYESDDSRHSTNETPFSPLLVARKSRSKQNRQNLRRNPPSSEADNHCVTYSNGFRCKLCGDSFESAELQEEHKLTHTTAKLPRSLSCTECGSTFHRRGHLLEHLDIHREPKHKCPKCNKGFVQRSNLKTHMSSCKGSAKQNAKTKASNDEDRSLCSYCPKSFKNARDMYKHVRNFHAEHELPKIPCKLCLKMFYSKPLLTAHVRKFHRSEIKESNDQRNE